MSSLWWYLSGGVCILSFYWGKWFCNICLKFHCLQTAFQLVLSIKRGISGELVIWLDVKYQFVNVIKTEYVRTKFISELKKKTEEKRESSHLLFHILNSIPAAKMRLCSLSCKENVYFKVTHFIFEWWIYFKIQPFQ